MGNLKHLLVPFVLVVFITEKTTSLSPADTSTHLCVPLDKFDFCSTTTSTDSEWFIIQPTRGGGLVLDASESDLIKLQNFTGHAQQLWKFERAGKPGVYYIITNHTGGVLDVDENSRPGKKLVVLKPKNASKTQNWMTNADGTIWNVGKNLNLDVPRAEYEAGNYLILWTVNGGRNQEFTLQQKN